MSLGLTGLTSTIDGGIKKIISGLETITLVISNEKMENIMKIVRSFKDSHLLIKSIMEKH